MVSYVNINTFFHNLQSRKRILTARNNRSLLKELVRAKFKINEHNSILGLLWSIIGPATMLLLMYLIFVRRFGEEIEAYPLYLLLGISTLNFFIVATTVLAKSFYLDRAIALNTALPREHIPVAYLCVEGYKFIVQMVLCVILSLAYGVFSGKHFLLLIPVLVAYIFFLLGIGFILAIIHCHIRDIEHIWAIATRLLFFATPIFYSLESVSRVARTLVYWVNPLTPFLITFRQIFIGTGNINFVLYTRCVVTGVLFLLGGYIFFLINEGNAIERI